MEEHQVIQRHLKTELNSKNELMVFAKLLENHIRFEERELFEVMQDQIDESMLLTAGERWEETDFCLLYPDPFWQAY